MIEAAGCGLDDEHTGKAVENGALDRGRTGGPSTGISEEWMGMGNVRALCSCATSHDHGRRSSDNGTAADRGMHRGHVCSEVGAGKGVPICVAVRVRRLPT